MQVLLAMHARLENREKLTYRDIESWKMLMKLYLKVGYNCSKSIWFHFPRGKFCL